MNTCKDCIHCDVCSYVEKNGDGRVLKNSPCFNFKDKSHIIELPFNTGDTVYYLSWDPCINICIKDCNPVILHDKIISLEFHKILDDSFFIVNASHCSFGKGFNEYWFTDKSEAEQKVNQILNLQNGDENEQREEK